MVRGAFGQPTIDIEGLAKQLNRTPASLSLKASRNGWSVSGREWPQQRKDAQAVAMKRRIATGLQIVPTFTGHHHSEDARARISAANKGKKVAPCSDATRLAMSVAMSRRLRAAGNVYSNARRGRRADLGGLFVRSGWEANYARYLNWLVAQCVIKSWAYEPQTFWFERIRRGTRSYTPDFLVTRFDGSHYWVEVKGYMDPKSKTKLARMKRYHPTEEVQVVGPKEYAALVRQFDGMIAHWESKRAS